MTTEKPAESAEPAKVQIYLLQFTANWCKPCRKMRPIIKALRRDGYDIRDAAAADMRSFRVRVLPTYILLRQRPGERAKAVGRITGAVPRETLERLFRQAAHDILYASQGRPPGWLQRLCRWFGQKEV